MTTPNSTFQKPFEAATGPWSNLSHTYCKQMDASFRASEPVLQALTRIQLEWTQLALSRGRAWATLPLDVSRCRSPADLAMLQFNFWQTAGRAYAQGWQRLMAVSNASVMDAGSAAEAGARDVLAVPDAEKTGRNRQAA